LSFLVQLGPDHGLFGSRETILSVLYSMSLLLVYVSP